MEGVTVSGKPAQHGDLGGTREQAPVSEAKDSVDPSTPRRNDAMDSSETSTGRRERAPVQSIPRKRCLGNGDGLGYSHPID